jgi:putative two-component system response regulator
MHSPGKVLVVDDYEVNARGLRDLLVSAGYSVRMAHTGEDALRLAAEDPPDIVLLDVVMPGISGIDVCRELKARPTTRLIPIVLITASQDRTQRLSGLEAGADEFLTKPVDISELRTRVQSLIRVKRLTDELESTDAIMTMLGQIVEARDPYTEGHCERLAAYSTAVGMELGLPAEDLATLRSGAYLHDLGKIGVPDSVLLKPGPLSEEELAQMRAHTVIGDDLCGTVRSLEAVRAIVRWHHERVDGRGYPDGLKGNAIPLLAQIVGVVDVFDALTTARPYRPAMATETAYNVMVKDAESGWRPQSLVMTFIGLHQRGAGEAAFLKLAPAVEDAMPVATRRNAAFSLLQSAIWRLAPTKVFQ